MKHLFLLLAFCLAVPQSAKVAFAQSVNGLISGTVLDPNGASIPEETVTVTDQLTTSQTTQTEQNGDFVFPEIRPGTYNLVVEKTGFARLDAFAYRRRRFLICTRLCSPSAVSQRKPSPSSQ